MLATVSRTPLHIATLIGLAVLTGCNGLPGRDAPPTRLALEPPPGVDALADEQAHIVRMRAVNLGDALVGEGTEALLAWSAHVRAVDQWWEQARAAIPRTREPDLAAVETALHALDALQEAQNTWTLRCPAPLDVPLPEMPPIDAPEQAWAAFIDATLRRELAPPAAEDASEAIVWGAYVLADAERVLSAVRAGTDPQRLDWAWQALHDRFNAWSAAMEAVPEHARRPEVWWGAGCPGRLTDAPRTEPDQGAPR